MIFLLIFLKLAIGHFVCDFPLQGDFLARAKNHKNPIPGVPWGWALFAHSAIQAGMVWYVAGSLACGTAEFFMHAYTDYLKSDGVIGFTDDQLAHLFWKLVYVVILYLFSVL